ncbi:MAG: CZB domain-containing protein [Rhodoferax sp.]|nr:CZB domain-containing protein [Rhodoferax sp.]
MDLSNASQAHAEWKVKFRMAIQQKSKMDASSIAMDNCCPLGQWLHGEAKGLYNRLPAYRECLGKHAEFHRAAGQVAAAINRGDYAGASAMLEAGTPYAGASSAVGSAILGLKKAISAPATV